MTVFTPEEALKIIAEAEALLAKTRDCVEAGRFVEAEAWLEVVKEELEMQDVFGILASDEVIELEDSAPSPRTGCGRPG